MFYRVTHLTEDVFNLEIIEGSVASSVLLVDSEIEGLIDILSKRGDLDVHQSTEEWYNI